MHRVLISSLLLACVVPAAELRVSPGGRLKTLEQARDAARQLSASGPVTIVVRRGDYATRNTLELTSKDKGLTIRAEPGARVRLLGGVTLKGFKPLRDPAMLSRLDPAARTHVLECDLGAMGITDYGRLSSRGFGRKPTPAHMELFFGDRRMTLAQWPNKGFIKIADIAGKPNDDEHGGALGRLDVGFHYEEDRPSRWKSFDDIWVHGYWAWDWANSYEHVAAIDQPNKLILTDPPYGNYGFRKGQRFYFLNVFEELDQPGEYFVDRRAGKLYFWPPAPVRSAEAAVSIFDGPAIRVKDADNITISGFTVEYLRGNGIEVYGGSGVRIADCTLRNLGDSAVIIEGGRQHSISGSSIYQTGDAGIHLAGGDRPTLTAAGHEARNNDIHHIGQWSRTYQPGISISGVGNRIVHNVIHNGPHSGIQLSGNEHVIEYNEIHHMALETGDVGAFYMGRDYTMRGNIIRYNFFHHTGGVGMGAMGVYMDDCSGGSTIYGNVFYKQSRAVFLGGGRDNTVENNIFVECDPAVQIDARGLDPRPVWHNMVYKTMRFRLEEMKPHQPPYSTRYPELAQLDQYYEQTDGIPPEGNRVLRNVCVGKWLDIRWRADPKIIDVQDNLTDEEPLFVDTAKMNFQLRDDSPAYKLGFKRIPFDKIGLEKK